jgi:hypothetical protein
MSCTPTSKSSGLLAAGTTAVKASKTYLNAVTAVGDGTNVATVTVYDNASAGSGTVLWKGVVLHTFSVSFANPVRAELGITVVVAGTNSGAVIHYDA